MVGRGLLKLHGENVVPVMSATTSGALRGRIILDDNLKKSRNANAIINEKNSHNFTKKAYMHV